MKKKFIKYTKKYNTYYPVPNYLSDDKDYFLSCNEQIGNLHGALNYVQDLVRKEVFDTVFIYGEFDLKKKVEIEFRNMQDKLAYEQAYDEYYDKRYDDMPQIEMSLQDYAELEAKWEVINEELPPYVIFSLDDSGPLDKVDVIRKNDLTEQDKVDMQREHERYLKWEKAWSLYQYDHPQIDDYWGGPADSFYEKDLEKYYGRDEPFSCKLSFTPEQVGKQLKVFIEQKIYPELIGHWFCRLQAYGFPDYDKPYYTKPLDYLLTSLEFLRLDTYKKTSYERLDEIANMLVEGKDLSQLPEIQGFSY